MSGYLFGLRFIAILFFLFMYGCEENQQEKIKPRILVSTDIGGTDPDDNQSMIHLLMYANEFQIEGLVSTSFQTGTTQNILEMIDLYEKDLSELKKHASDFPNPNDLRAVTKQGTKKGAPFRGYRESTEGSNWIIKCAKKQSNQPLWVLVWGGIEDVAQALHDAPEIEDKIRVYWIGGPNKKWGANAYAYIAENHPNLWMIENNATYRGWFMDSESPENLKGDTYFANYIKGRGHMGKDFVNYYDGRIKMGDTPSLAYVMNGKPDDPTTESWGGEFIKISHSSRTIFQGNSRINDTVKAYGIQEWYFKGPELDISQDSVCFTMEISKQIWPGYYLGNGVYATRYSSKKPETASYKTSSAIPELDGQTGQYVSIKSWPGKKDKDDYTLGDNWYGDRPDEDLFLKDQQGAKTVSKHRKAFLMDWAKRWKWLNN
ncbi:nucleoside hydrolase-like domain-containing protein [Flavisericum labens]|uniref:nucleoside hydrolase-like domain-containing protein n=1 Tax=Flavisericum labens TaxID=3377112 RepID=UPI00387B6D18